jgi:hypothetical protein
LDSAQETRLQRVEGFWTTASAQLAGQAVQLDRVESALTTGLEKLDATMDRVEGLVNNHAGRIATLEAKEHDRVSRRKAAIKWVGGIAASLVVAVVLFLFGLK